MGNFCQLLMIRIYKKKVRSLVFCSGKFYYDLLYHKRKNKISDVAIIRLEQLFPLPEKEIKKIIDSYSYDELVWAQEEPRNMGAWGHLLMHLEIAKTFRVASRRFYGAPASGSKARFDKRHKEVIDYVFDKSKNNMK